MVVYACINGGILMNTMIVYGYVKYTKYYYTAGLRIVIINLLIAV